MYGFHVKQFYNLWNYRMENKRESINQSIDRSINQQSTNHRPTDRSINHKLAFVRVIIAKTHKYCYAASVSQKAYEPRFRAKAVIFEKGLHRIHIKKWRRLNIL